MHLDTLIRKIFGCARTGGRDGIYWLCAVDLLCGLSVPTHSLLAAFEMYFLHVLDFLVGLS